MGILQRLFLTVSLGWNKSVGRWQCMDNDRVRRRRSLLTLRWKCQGYVRFENMARGKCMIEEKDMHTWEDWQIREFYDNNPNLLLSTYAGMLGLSVGELKEILMPSK